MKQSPVESSVRKLVRQARNTKITLKTGKFDRKRQNGNFTEEIRKSGSKDTASGAVKKRTRIVEIPGTACVESARCGKTEPEAVTGEAKGLTDRKNWHRIQKERKN